MVKSRGPSTDPWGTPWLTGAMVEVASFRVTLLAVGEVGLKTGEG